MQRPEAQGDRYSTPSLSDVADASVIPAQRTVQGGQGNVQSDDGETVAQAAAAVEAAAADVAARGQHEVNLRQIFDTIDRNKDEQISRAELILALRTDDRINDLLNLPPRIREDERRAFETVFQSMDSDDSRGVTFRQFVEYMKRIQNLGAESGAKSAARRSRRREKQASESSSATRRPPPPPSAAVHGDTASGAEEGSGATSNELLQALDEAAVGRRVDRAGDRSGHSVEGRETSRRRQSKRSSRHRRVAPARDDEDSDGGSRRRQSYSPDRRERQREAREELRPRRRRDGDVDSLNSSYDASNASWATSSSRTRSSSRRSARHRHSPPTSSRRRVHHRGFHADDSMFRSYSGSGSDSGELGASERSGNEFYEGAPGQLGRLSPLSRHRGADRSGSSSQSRHREADRSGSSSERSSGDESDDRRRRRDRRRGRPSRRRRPATTAKGGPLMLEPVAGSAHGSVTVTRAPVAIAGATVASGDTTVYPDSIVDRSCYIFSENGVLRQKCRWLCQQKFFEHAVLTVIIMNSCTLAMYDPLAPTSGWNEVLAQIEHVFT